MAKLLDCIIIPFITGFQHLLFLVHMCLYVCMYVSVITCCALLVSNASEAGMS